MQSQYRQKPLKWYKHTNIDIRVYIYYVLRPLTVLYVTYCIMIDIMWHCFGFLFKYTSWDKFMNII